MSNLEPVSVDSRRHGDSQAPGRACYGSERSCAAVPKCVSAGIGLKPVHFDPVLDSRPALGFFEVHAENYMLAGGPMLAYLDRIRSHYPITLHGVGLSIGGTEPPDESHLDRLAALIDRYQPALFSEHLAWSSHDGVFFNDLLPLPYDRTSLQRVCAHIERIQERLGRRMLLENPSTYFEFRSSTMSEAQFLAEIVTRTGCALLLDLNNAYVSSINHGRDAGEFIDALPLEAVCEIHLAGFARDRDSRGAALLIDTHGAPVDSAVWRLYERLIQRIGAVPTLIERDHDLPPLQTLVAEAALADRLLAASARMDAAA